MSTIFSVWKTRGIAALREFGPYAAAELLLPGGTLLAILFWLYRRYHRQREARA